MKVITALIAGQDIFVVLLIGYGKGLCYVCLPLLFDHLYQLEDSQRSIVIVVTPLTTIIRPGKSNLVPCSMLLKSLLYNLVSLPLGHILNQSTDFSFYWEISSPQPIQCIAESSHTSLGLYIN